MGQKLKYPHVAEQIIQKIRTGEYPIGSELPTLDDITKDYSISRMTAQSALKIVARKGYVSTNRGRKSKIISRECLDQQNAITGKRIGILAQFDMGTHSATPLPLRILYHVQQKLKELDNHVLCYQYVDDLVLNPDDADAYIMIDLFGYRSQFQDLLYESGKPFVVIDNLREEGSRPNHIHLFYQSVFLEMTSLFLKNEINDIVFVNVDAKSISKSLDNDSFDDLNRRLLGSFLQPITKTLQNHGLGRDHIHLLNTGLQPEETAKAIKKMLRQGLTEKTAFLVVSENIALGAYQALREHGWKSGKDFFIVNINPEHRSILSMPEFLGINVRLEEVFIQAAKSLSYQFQHKTTFVPGCLVEASFIPGSHLM